MVIRYCVGFIALALVLLGCKGDQGPAGVQGPGYDGLADPSVKPKVIYSYPGNNTTGPYENFNTIIQVRFNKIMDRTLLRRALHITSSAGDVQADTATIASSNGDVFSVYPKSVAKPTFRWKIGQVYTLRIDSSAKDINGNNLIPEFLMTFTPEPYLRVRSSSPTSGSVNVNPRSTIAVTFNNVVDTSIFHLITITPPLQGTWNYSRISGDVIDSTYIRYRMSSNAMLTSTPYRITIPAGARDKQGNVLPFDNMISYTTYSFDVRSTSPGDGTTDVSLYSQRITIAFNDLIDTATARSAFTITPPLNGFLVVSYDMRTLEFISLDDLPPSTVFTVSLDTTLRSFSGERLSVPYSFSFTTAAFQVQYTDPYEGSSDIVGYNPIYIYFNATIDTGSVRSSFSIAPPIQGLFDFTSSKNGFRFSPLTQFLTDTTYTVTVSTTMSSKSGNPLSAPYTFSFKTGSFEIVHSYPGNGTTGVSRYSTINLYSNLPFDTSTVRGAFHIEPSVDGYLNMNQSLTTIILYPSGGLSANTIYTVSVDTTLHSVDGARMKRPFAMAFATGD